MLCTNQWIRWRLASRRLGKRLSDRVLRVRLGTYYGIPSVGRETSLVRPIHHAIDVHNTANIILCGDNDNDSTIFTPALGCRVVRNRMVLTITDGYHSLGAQTSSRKQVRIGRLSVKPST